MPFRGDTAVAAVVRIAAAATDAVLQLATKSTTQKMTAMKAQKKGNAVAAKGMATTTTKKKAMRAMKAQKKGTAVAAMRAMKAQKMAKTMSLLEQHKAHRARLQRERRAYRVFNEARRGLAKFGRFH